MNCQGRRFACPDFYIPEHYFMLYFYTGPDFHIGAGYYTLIIAEETEWNDV